jgi:hypothetical protein
MRKGRPLPACPAGVLHGDTLRTASIINLTSRDLNSTISIYTEFIK